MLDIDEVSERLGVPPSALRRYEKLGLIASVSRKGLRRQ
ncbi:MAG: MerR family DNA-binding transcriptional regulator [Pseudomonadota bacterium]